MKIKDSYKNLIVDEMEFAIRKMNKTQDGLEKMFYFSAVFGVLHRVPLPREPSPFPLRLRSPNRQGSAGCAQPDRRACCPDSYQPWPFKFSRLRLISLKTLSLNSQEFRLSQHIFVAGLARVQTPQSRPEVLPLQLRFIVLKCCHFNYA